MRGNSRSRACEVSAFESSRPAIRPRSGRTQAATTRGPAHAPRPASSAPATAANPLRRTAASYRQSPLASSRGGRTGRKGPTTTGRLAARLTWLTLPGGCHLVLGVLRTRVVVRASSSIARTPPGQRRQEVGQAGRPDRLPGLDLPDVVRTRPAVFADR